MSSKNAFQSIIRATDRYRSIQIDPERRALSFRRLFAGIAASQRECLALAKHSVKLMRRYQLSKFSSSGNATGPADSGRSTSGSELWKLLVSAH